MENYGNSSVEEKAWVAMITAILAYFALEATQYGCSITRYPDGDGDLDDY